MIGFNLEQEGDNILALIKMASWFPYKSGKLKFHATSGGLVTSIVPTYRIHFDSTIAPYVAYLEEGTSPHDIPRAFGRPLPFGIGGRFNGKFHSGSTKHQGFIKEKCVQYIVDYIANKYEGVVTTE